MRRPGTGLNGAARNATVSLEPPRRPDRAIRAYRGSHMSYATAKTVDAESIPVIDIGELHSGAPAGLKAVADDLARAASTVGFFYIKNHGVPQSLIDDVFARRGRSIPSPFPSRTR